MPTRKVTVAPGQQKDGELIEVENSSEPWATYKLADGTTLKAKLVLSEVWRIENEFDAEGNPAYFVKVSPLINVSAAEEMKRKVN